MSNGPDRRRRDRRVVDGEPSWKWRRVIIYIVLAWACFQLHRLVNAPDTRVNESIAWGWQVIIISLVLGYTGFATAQDVAAIVTTRTARPYADPPPDPVPAPGDQIVVVQKQDSGADSQPPPGYAG